MTTGEGGMITTNNKLLYEKMKSMKNFGRDNNDAGLIITSMEIISKLMNSQDY